MEKETSILSMLPKETLIKALILFLGLSGGGGAATYLEAGKFEVIESEIKELKNERENNKQSIKAIESLLIVINYDICMLRSNQNHSARAECERERNRNLANFNRPN